MNLQETRSNRVIYFLFISFLIAGLFPGKSFAQTTFGAEFTFTNDDILNAPDGDYVNSDKSEFFRDALAANIAKECDGCRLADMENAYGVKTIRVTYPDGFFFTVATDPAVVEVQVMPMTSEQIKRYRNRLDHDLFQSATNLGIKPSPKAGGGHIHIGYLSSTQGELRLARDFIVDFANHPEIASGVLENDNYNAPPVAALPREKQKALAQIIADVDSGKIKSVKKMAKRIQKEVYDWHIADWGPFRKYHALNLTRIAGSDWDDSERTFEIRSLRAQNSMEEFALLTQLFEGRFKYLSRLEKPVPLNIPDLSKMDAAKKYDRFSRYVGEAGISFDHFRKGVALMDSWTASKTIVHPYSCSNVMSY